MSGVSLDCSWRSIYIMSWVTARKMAHEKIGEKHGTGSLFAQRLSLFFLFRTVFSYCTPATWTPGKGYNFVFATSTWYFRFFSSFDPENMILTLFVHNHVLVGIWIHLRSSFPRPFSRQLAFVLVDQFFYCYNALTSCLSVSRVSITLLSRSISRSYGQTFNRFYQQRIWFAQYIILVVMCKFLTKLNQHFKNWFHHVLWRDLDFLRLASPNAP